MRSLISLVLVASVLVACLAFAPAACRAQEEIRFVYPTPAATDSIERRNLVYKGAGQSELLMDVFLPARGGATKRLPVFIIFNGYGGASMRSTPQSEGWAKAATGHGFAAVTVETTPGHSAEDFDSLAVYLREHAKDLGVDAERLVVIAWSGHVAAGLPAVEDPRRTAIKAAVIYYGSADLPHVRLDLPVLFVRAGLDQPLANEAFDKVIAAGVAANAPWTVLNYPGGRHGFDLFDDNDLSREIIEETFRFAQLAVSDGHQSALRGGLAEASAAGAMFTGEFTKAAALYQGLAVAHPQDARLLLAYGIALSGTGKYKEARAQFDRAKAIGGLGRRDLGLPAARACALDHDAEAAMAWLKTIPPQYLPAGTQSDPAFAALRERADFQAIFRSY